VGGVFFFFFFFFLCFCGFFWGVWGWGGGGLWVVVGGFFVGFFGVGFFGGIGLQSTSARWTSLRPYAFPSGSFSQ